MTSPADDAQARILEVLETTWSAYWPLPSSDYRDLGLTSLDIVDAIVALEEAFDLSFNDDQLDLRNFYSLESIVATVKAAQDAS